MNPPFATLAELAERLGTVLDEHAADGQRALAALVDASELIRSEGGKTWLDEHGEVLAELPAIIASITLAVAYRAYTNPSGTSQSSVGDVSVSYAREGVAGAVYLTRAERRAVRRAAGATPIGTVQLETSYLARATPDAGDEWWEIQ